METRDTGDISGLVLAGGGSRRFGTRKALFPIDGRPMIEQIIETVLSVCQPVLIGVGSEALPIEPENTRQIRDEIHDAGPLGGLCAAFDESDTPWLLVVACDMPFLTEDALRSLSEARSPAVQAVVATSSGGCAHPLCACYHRSTLPVAEKQLANGHLAMRDFLKQLGRIETVCLPDSALRNLNTPGDLSPHEE